MFARYEYFRIPFSYFNSLCLSLSITLLGFGSNHSDFNGEWPLNESRGLSDGYGVYEITNNGSSQKWLLYYFDGSWDVRHEFYEFSECFCLARDENLNDCSWYCWNGTEYTYYSGAFSRFGSCTPPTAVCSQGMNILCACFISYYSPHIYQM